MLLVLHQLRGPKPGIRMYLLARDKKKPIELCSDFQANDARKKVPSSLGMRRSVETSALLKFRAEVQVPRNVEKMVKVRLSSFGLSKIARV